MILRINKAAGGGLTIEDDGDGTLSKGFVWPGHVWFDHAERRWAWAGWRTPTMYYDTLEELIERQTDTDLRALPCNWDVI